LSGKDARQKGREKECQSNSETTNNNNNSNNKIIDDVTLCE